MAEDAGDGTTKVQKLREAASIFVGAMLPGDAIGLVRFDDTAQRLMDITEVGPLNGTGGPGDGDWAHHQQRPGPRRGDLDRRRGGRGCPHPDRRPTAASPPYDVQAMVVLSDGVENTTPMLSAVGSSITASTFAIGLGLPANISVASLTALTQGNNGYLVVTGELTTDQRTRLTKYFLQVLAGITNASIVVDPSVQVPPGVVHRVPFDLTEADYGLDVFLLTPDPGRLECVLEAPDGTIIDAAVLADQDTGEQALRPGMWLYRVALPAVPSQPDGTHAGRWHALVRVRRGKGGRYTSEYQPAEHATATTPCDVVVHAYSSLELKGWLTQPGYTPGSHVSLHARLVEYSRVVETGAQVWAEVTDPGGITFGVAMPKATGQFRGGFTATIPGIYRARIRCQGITAGGSPFTREFTLTAVIMVGRAHPSNGGPDPWCELLRCLSGNRKLIERLGEGADDLLKCLGASCRRPGAAELELATLPVTAGGTGALGPAAGSPARVRGVCRLGTSR